mgnify:CR=1 FL=1
MSKLNYTAKIKITMRLIDSLQSFELFLQEDHILSDMIQNDDIFSLNKLIKILDDNNSQVIFDILNNDGYIADIEDHTNS